MSKVSELKGAATTGPAKRGRKRRVHSLERRVLQPPEKGKLKSAAFAGVETKHPDSASAPRRRNRGPMRLSLKELREGAGKTQVEMATLLETDQAAISRLEQRDDTSVSTLHKWAKALGLQLDIVFSSPHGHRIHLMLGDLTPSSADAPA